MPVEIKELVIKTTISGPDMNRKSASGSDAAGEQITLTPADLIKLKQQILNECMAKISDTRVSSKER
jgi:hypothetical protein